MNHLTTSVPKILIYEEFDGHPVYRKGYKEFLLGLKTIEEIGMGTSTLQWFITSIINRYLGRTLPDNYMIGSAELGLHISKNTNFSADIAIYREGLFQVGFHSTQYADTPPNVVIEVDIKIDEYE
jgi:Uma2 family endonuclease